MANISSPNGLYDTTTYDNVIDANVRNGEFDQCLINGIPTGSLLLHFGCVYDADNNVDLALTRKPFDQIAGLNANGVADGTGLDSYFNVNLTGGAATMFADLFLISDAANFDVALNQLSGSVYANYLNSFPSLGVHYDDLVDHATNCENPGACRFGLGVPCVLADPHLGSARLPDAQGRRRHRGGDSEVEAVHRPRRRRCERQQCGDPWA